MIVIDIFLPCASSSRFYVSTASSKPISDMPQANRTSHHRVLEHYAFIKFENTQLATDVLQQLDGTRFCGVTLISLLRNSIFFGVTLKVARANRADEILRNPLTNTSQQLPLVLTEQGTVLRKNILLLLRETIRIRR